MIDVRHKELDKKELENLKPTTKNDKELRKKYKRILEKRHIRPQVEYVTPNMHKENMKKCRIMNSQMEKQ